MGACQPIIQKEEGAHAAPIYVEIFIRGSLEEIWQLTQDPALHQRWDFRFSEITYLPKTDPDEAQRFSYQTRIGFGLAIKGFGETTGAMESASGPRSSALKFWSDSPVSLIRAGSGYWKYIPEQAGVRFLTKYTYQVRFGFPGKVFDRMIFRPLMGWATALSFDRLRLWVESGIPPEISCQKLILNALARISVAFVWFYHGIVPKLLFHSYDEVIMMSQSGIPGPAIQDTIKMVGWTEAVFGLVTLLFWRAKWPLQATWTLMIVALAAVAWSSRQYLYSAFNAVTLNLLVAAMCTIGLMTGAQLPSARNCFRKPS